MDQTSQQSEVDRCRAEIRAYQAEYAALSPDKQAQVRAYHYMGLADWTLEELLVLNEYSLQEKGIIVSSVNGNQSASSDSDSG